MNEDNHCEDCCCAQSWKALGVTTYTGKSIPEHITELREAASRQYLTIGPFRVTRTPGKLHIRCGEGEGGEFAEKDLEAVLAEFWKEKF